MQFLRGTSALGPSIPNHNTSFQLCVGNSCEATFVNKSSLYQ